MNYKNFVLPDKYIPKVSDKEYMSVEHRAYFYRVLMAEKKEAEMLISDVQAVVSLGQKMEAAGAMDEGDQATLSVEADFEIKQRDRARNYLAKIEAALQRLEKGTYGYSVLSGDEIGIKRLLVSPAASLTMEEVEEKDR